MPIDLSKIKAIDVHVHAEVTPERWGSILRSYIECSQDRAIPLSSQRKMQEMSPGAARVTLDSDHSPFLSRPAELAAALIGAIPASHA